ncbi:hypothetical protein GGS21DRAFT_504950 [Xylaria nigripes]|nr:hypothetical protein GGS21DRAFT_504950 [Xylaria nigripes]
MEPETKRPRLTGTSSWSQKLQGQSVSLPPVSGGPHHPPPSPYQTSPSFSRPSESPLPSAHHQSHEDRRFHHHHDHEPFPPIQDTPRQLPPSPAHPPYPSYPPRDPILKRDAGEEPGLSQLHRQGSASHVVDGLPPAHVPPHPNQQYPDDPRRHMNFDNGVPMSHSPALYRAPAPPLSYHPPPPTQAAQQPPYDGPPGYLPPTQIYPAVEIQAASAKRRPQRASQACDNCRQLKAKCDETKPCKNCREKNINCKYRDPPAKQPDKVTADILEMLTLVRDEISSINKKVSKIDARLSNLENISMQGNSEAIAKLKIELMEEDEQPTVSDGRDTHEHEDDVTETSTPGRTSVVAPSLSLNEAHETLRQGEIDDIENRPGPIVAPGPPAMPPNHTTRASLLLNWPSINDMVGHILKREKIYVESYPMKQEQQRGSLRIFGRGEGRDVDVRISDKGTPQDYNMTDGEDASDTPPAFSPGSWGQVGSLALGPGVDNKGGVLTVDGNPDWDPNKLRTYVQSFKDNMLNMHPIIIPKELDAMCKVFLEELPKSFNTSSTKAAHRGAGFIHPHGSAVTPEAGHPKRKRSPAGDDQSPVVSSFRKPGRPFRNVQNTLVLLVFALGKICLHRNKIPDVVHELDDFASSPSTRDGGVTTPGQGSPAGFFPPSQSSGLPSPKENDRAAAMMSRRSSVQGNTKSHRISSTYKRNIDVIPGLEYFALASDMMGGDYGSFGLKHVYVHILAGLYHGQLGRVMESWEHITTASRKLQVELQPRLDYLSKLEGCSKEDGRDNKLAFAFWTCLQLESDILAELQLPQSGILAYESQMPYPNTSFAVTHGFEQRVAEGYLAQLYLRKKLNMVHNLLYDPNKDEVEHRYYSAMEQEINEIQNHIKKAKNAWVPKDYYWDDDDETLPIDFLEARLRAKYWGSQVILYRPFVRLILNADAQASRTYQNEHGPLDMINPTDMNEQNAKRHHSLAIKYAQLAIQALIKSTCAFHGLDRSRRIIVTNVFGTAHAQWGNLLTLSACFKNPTLHQFIDPARLKELFSRTIEFLRMNSQPSSALHTDMTILIGLEKELGFVSDETDLGTVSSFSSVTNSEIMPPMHHTSNSYPLHGASYPPP